MDYQRRSRDIVGHGNTALNLALETWRMIQFHGFIHTTGDGRTRWVCALDLVGNGRDGKAHKGKEGGGGHVGENGKKKKCAGMCCWLNTPTFYSSISFGGAGKNRIHFPRRQLGTGPIWLE